MVLLNAHSLEENIIKSERVKAAMLDTDRGLYCPTDAYTDHPVSIGHRATISAPHMHAYCLDLLEGHLLPGSRALGTISPDPGSPLGLTTL